MVSIVRIQQLLFNKFFDSLSHYMRNIDDGEGTKNNTRLEMSGVLTHRLQRCTDCNAAEAQNPHWPPWGCKIAMEVLQ